MHAKLNSVALAGFNGYLIAVECNLSNGLPNMSIIGLANKSIDESKERIRSAFSNMSITMPRKRIVINLAPADIPKEGTSFDMAIAVAILVAAELVKIEKKEIEETIFIGEIGLDGTMRPASGTVGRLKFAKSQGIKTAYIPIDNLKQAMLIKGLQIIVIKDLRQLYLHLTKVQQLKPIFANPLNITQPKAVKSDVDFNEVVGQEQAKRALLIAAAGGHNILLDGPPGSGKSMLAKAFVSIMPPLEQENIIDLTHLYSLSSHNYADIITTRPFLNPHHSASNISILGGGPNPKPGAISLAHKGVLFLDELPEFNRQVIESLRQPLEDKKITIARSKDTVTYPADFILIATRNPCPCGYFGTAKDCSCLPTQIINYNKKLSGPIIDRIDLYITVTEVAHKNLLEPTKSSDTSENLIQSVKIARALQSRRLGESRTNSLMTNREIKKFASLAPDVKAFFDKASEKLQLSARSYMRTIKVARTITDLGKCDAIEIEHIAEALQYRQRGI